MRFEWDPQKARSNLAKHGVSFETAQRVWDEPLLEIAFDRFEDGEERWHALGTVNGMTLLVVIQRYPDEEGEGRVRIIGARRAETHERKRYEEPEAQ